MTAPTDPAVTVVDHRLLNWRFVVPSVPDGLLLLAAADEAGEVPGAVACDPALAALRSGPHPAVVVSDLGRWTAAAAKQPAGQGAERTTGGDARGGGGGKDLLRLAAEAVAPGGWLYASFANPLYPMRSRSAGGALTLAAACRVVRGAGLRPSSRWLAFPDQHTPAYLVPAGGGPELEYFMRTFFFPYAGGGSGRKARLRQRALTLMRGCALLAPPAVRPRFAPAFAIVAERPELSVTEPPGISVAEPPA
jgi:hypothetical protein